MAKMILSMDGLVLKEIDLNKERLTIGRRPHNDVVIDNLAVSGEHAVVVTILNDSFLEDMGSTNGTTVNGQPIKKHFLQNNDVVELGKYKLKYLTDSSAVSAGPDFGKSTARTNAYGKAAPAPAAVPPAEADIIEDTPAVAAFRAGGSSSAKAATRPAPQAPAAPSPAPVADGVPATAVIQILSGPNAGKEVILSKSLTTLGRPGVQVAVITRRSQGYFITHVEGEGFPILNGKTLGPEAHPVKDHDIIELSGTKMEFFFQ